MMEPMPESYTLRLYQYALDGSFVLSVVDPPTWGIIGVGDTPAEAAEDFGKALAAALEDEDLVPPGPIPAVPMLQREEGV